MKINSHYLNDQKVSFKQANANIMALGDTHGDLMRLPFLYDTFEINHENIFENHSDPSTKNIMAVVGDWFINPLQTGYINNPETTSGEIQEKFLSRFIREVKKYIPDIQTIFTPGNHCLDGGSKSLTDHVKNINMNTVMTDVDIENSSLIQSLPENEREKFSQFKVIEIPDDKNPDIKHKILVMGIAPINLNYYIHEDLSGLEFIGKNKSDKVKSTPEELEHTLSTIDAITKQFKQENPTAAVVLLNHAGESTAQYLAENVEDIDLIFNGHDHLDKTSIVTHQDGKKTPIVSLSRDSNKLSSANIHFDDDGKFDIDIQSYKTNFKTVNNRNNKLVKLFHELFNEDLKPQFSIIDPKRRELLKTSGIRYSNNDLANFCTDSLFEAIRNDYPDTTIFGIAASTFREDLPTSNLRPVSNLDLINLLNGIGGTSAQVMTGQIPGNIFADFIMENLTDNKENKYRHPLIQYSGVIINLAKIHKLLDNNAQSYSSETFCPYIQVRNKDGKFEQLDPNKTYNIAIPQKLVKKATNPQIKQCLEQFEGSGKKVSDYFREFTLSQKEEITLNIDTRIIQ